MAICLARSAGTEAPCTNLAKNGKYCGRHTKVWERYDEVQEKGGQVCSNWTSKNARCPNELDPDESEGVRRRCKSCRDKGNAGEAKARAQKKADALTVVDLNKQKCVGKCGQIRDKALFVGPPGQGHCQICREKQDVREKTRKEKEKKKADEGIVTTRVQAAREYEHRTERQESKKRRREENPERQREYDEKSRKKRREEDEEGYLARNAEDQKRWRDNNPDMVLIQRYNSRLATKTRMHKKIAADHGIADELSDEDLQGLMEEGVCFFGGEDDTSLYLMSVTRLNVAEGFTTFNSRAACRGCVVMKGSLDPRTFIERCIYIANLRKGGVCPYPAHLFKERLGSTFVEYTERASKKGLPFELTKEQFDEIRKGPCYVCNRGNQPGFHQNGIDRMDNEAGYTLLNARACCGECNYMKREFKFDEFVGRIALVVAKAEENLKKLVTDAKRVVAYK
jgi:hypothetical protein